MFISHKKILVAAAGLLMIPVFALAQTDQELIAQLRAEIASLKVEIASLKGQVTTTQQEVVQAKQELNLTRTLFLGAKGSDVEQLQEFLKQYPDIYPDGLVTGYFGKLTEKAVKMYQKKYGIDQVGVVGPKTRTHMHNRYSEGMLDVDDDDDSDDDSDNSSSDKKTTICHNGNTLSIAKAALSAHLAHGDTEGACSGTATTTDVTVPVISSIVATPFLTSAVIAWTTNESSNSVVKYATTSPVMSAGTILTAQNSAKTKAHALTLTGLSSGTTYYYLVMSTDAAGNTATGTELSFTTTVADTIAPVISSVSATTTSSTASVAWTTNESSNSVVKYATSSPVVSGTNVFTVQSSAMLTSHILSISGLSASTTYYYVPFSTDAAGNTATGTESTFVTQ